MNIVGPYVQEETPHVYDTHDKVERFGFVPNEEKIETFIETGMILQNMRVGGDAYEIQGDETENEPDSQEYLDELTADAENFTEQPLEQFMDKITAVETLSNAELQLKQAESAKSRKKKDSADEASRAVVNAIKEGFNSLKEPSKAESEPK